MKILPAENMQRVCARLERLYGEKATPRLLERVALLAGRYGVAQRQCYAKSANGPLWDQTNAVLITYGDIVRAPHESPLQTLGRFLDQRLPGVFSDVHILPFSPYSSDDGFAVIDYCAVDPHLGTWKDIRGIGKQRRLLFDLVLNHVSSESRWFRHYINGVAPARDYFIEMDRDADLESVVRPRPHPLLTRAQTPRGQRWVWTTFSADQIDLNFANPDVLFEFLDILLFYVQNGAHIIRLDAIAYLWKRPGTTCVNLPETHEVVKLLHDLLDVLAPGVLLLTETNLPHEQNRSYFGDGDEAHMIYQYSLSPLLLHALDGGSSRYLTQWAASLHDIPPGCTYLNITASHDGVGIRPLEGLVPDIEIQALIDSICQRGGQVSTHTGKGGTIQPYELNISYFDALGDARDTVTERHIARFLCSQTLMLALKGIPGTYFHSLTATRNDYAGMERSGHPRSINRLRWSERQLNEQLDEPASATARVFTEYQRLLRLRSEHAAFHPDAGQRVLDLPDGLFGVLRAAPGGEEQILSVSNVAHDARTLDLAAASDEVAAGPMHELIGGETLEAGRNAKIELAPYRTVWLSWSN